MLEYWGGPAHSYSFPKNVTFEHKIDTDLYEFVRHKTTPTRLTFSQDGRLFVVMGRDRKVTGWWLLLFFSEYLIPVG